MTNSRSSVDFPDSVNIESVIFDEQRKERSLFEVNLCCFEKKQRATELFLFLALHYLIIFVAVLFSIGYLELSLQTNYHSGVLALLSAFVGYIIFDPKP